MYFFSKGYKKAATGPVNTLAGRLKPLTTLAGLGDILTLPGQYNSTPSTPCIDKLPGYPIIMDWSLC